jgi:hypothetical protein
MGYVVDNSHSGRLTLRPVRRNSDAKLVQLAKHASPIRQRLRHPKPKIAILQANAFMSALQALLGLVRQEFAFPIIVHVLPGLLKDRKRKRAIRAMSI